jgi:hypothetical protein
MIVIRWFMDLLYASAPVEFESLFDVDQSVRRLADATGRTVFAAVLQQRAVGKVSASRVSLQRVIPFVTNSFKPYFIGEFRVSDHRVVLSGKFTMHWSSKLFMSFWFSFCVFWTLAVTTAVVIGDAEWWVPFMGVGLMCAGVGLVWLGKWFARNDVAWLSSVIRESLGGPSNNDRLEPDRRPARLRSRAASAHPRCYPAD